MLFRYLELVFFLVSMIVWTIISAVDYARRDLTIMWLSIGIAILNAIEFVLILYLLLGV